MLVPCLLTLPFSGWGWAHVLITFSVFFVYLIGQYYYLHFANGEVEAREVPMSCSPSRDRVETGNTCAFCMLPIRSPSYTAGHTCTSVHAAHQDSSWHTQVILARFPCCLPGSLIVHLDTPAPLSMLLTRIPYCAWLWTCSVLVKL